MGETMSQNSKATKPIKLETVYLIHIREKDGALSFALPGETVQFEDNEQIKTAMLAHKINELVTEMHKLQRVVFASNQMLADLLKGNSDEKTKQ